MSMYKCRICGNTGHLNDNLIGYFYPDIVCILCIKKIPEGPEKEAIWNELGEKAKKARQELKR